MTQAEIDKIIEKHQHWLNRDCEGWESMRANLEGATLYKVNLSHANLSRAYLCNANLYKADLTSVNLVGANLVGANLWDADLEKANLYETKLDDSEKCRQGTILTESMNGYKKTAEGNVIELEIPKGAIVFLINNNKCRTNKAIVKKCEGVQHSIFSYNFKYKEGDVLEIDNFNMQYNIECGEGIHFFRTKEDAKNYGI